MDLVLQPGGKSSPGYKGRVGLNFGWMKVFFYVNRKCIQHALRLPEFPAPQHQHRNAVDQREGHENRGVCQTLHHERIMGGIPTVGTLRLDALTNRIGNDNQVANTRPNGYMSIFCLSLKEPGVQMNSSQPKERGKIPTSCISRFVRRRL